MAVVHEVAEDPAHLSEAIDALHDPTASAEALRHVLIGGTPSVRAFASEVVEAEGGDELPPHTATKIIGQVASPISTLGPRDQRPVLPSSNSRMMSAWPACRAVSSSRCIKTQRRLTGGSSSPSPRHRSSRPAAATMRTDALPRAPIPRGRWPRPCRPTGQSTSAALLLAGEALNDPQRLRVGDVLQQPQQRGAATRRAGAAPRRRPRPSTLRTSDSRWYCSRASRVSRSPATSRGGFRSAIQWFHPRQGCEGPGVIEGSSNATSST